MGKGQSKHGHCYVVNAHFNPLCQLEENSHCNGIETPLASKDSGLHLTPELSFTLSEDKSNSEKDSDTKCALEVYLPDGPTNEAMKCSPRIDANSEKADGEKSEKEENQARIECLQKKDLEQQEFSFVLHNYNRDDMRKDDVEKVVVRSLCDALKSSLKLPLSGTHTLKVHLTVSPAMRKELQTENQSSGNESVSSDKDDHVPCRSGCSSKSDCSQKKDVDFMLSFVPDLNVPVKHSEQHTKCCEHDCLPKLSQTLVGDPKPTMSPSPHTKRSCKSSALKQEAQKWMDASELNINHGISSGQFSPRPCDAKERRHRSRHQGHRDRNHSVDLTWPETADIKMCPKQSTCDLRYANPAYYSPRLKEKVNLCHSVNQNFDFPDYHSHKKGLNIHHKIQDPEFHSHILKHKLLREAKNNMLDVSFDLGELNGKLETDPHHYHRRSKSYDMNDCCILNSPKARHRDCASVNSYSGHYAYMHIPQSPSRHHKHRHREREKDKQRAMQQVASWLEKEDLCKSKQNCFPESHFHNQKGEAVERHEYHHVHEHHHYYHYMDS